MIYRCHSSFSGSTFTFHHTHAHAHTSKAPSFYFLTLFYMSLAILRMGVLHSDGEMMTMAHYPLPEEWIWYIQYLYVLLFTRQISYLGPSSGSTKSNCMTLPAACIAEHTCSVSSETLLLAVWVEMSSERPTNAQNLTDVSNGAVTLILISFFFFTPH